MYNLLWLLIFITSLSNLQGKSLPNSNDISLTNDPDFIYKFNDKKFLQSVKLENGVTLQMYNDDLDIPEPEFRLQELEPEAKMTIEEIIQYHGYPVQTYNVTTEDGYILAIQRIEYGLKGPGSAPRKPVLVQHGLLCSSVSWVTNTKDKNLPYILADAGYDVWLGNIRGTKYGRKHLTLSPKENKFWEFSFDEMGKYDLPAVIDKILEETKQQHIHYVAHSMGSSMVFALLNSQPKYNNIIKGINALGPAIFVGNMRSPVKLLAPFANQIHYLMNLLGTGELNINNNFLKTLSATMCNSPVRLLCSSVIFLTCGFNLAQLNQTRLPVILHHTPDGTSSQNLVHLVQMVNTGKFQYHDYGASENLRRYSQEKPPEYDFNKITTKVAVYFGQNDMLVTPEDISKAAQKFPNLVLKYKVPDEKFSHTDFMWAIDSKTLLYNKVMDTMRRMW